jgi:large subunit ribosomal protein L6
MRKDLERIVEVPKGIEVVVDRDAVCVKKGGKKISRRFDKGKVSIKYTEGKIMLNVKNATRRESKMIGTIEAHLINMIKGMDEDFVYTLEICNVHFPMNVKVEGNKAVIKSFLGEKMPRESEILPEVKVEIKGNQITVSSHNIESAGQTAANFEKATRLTGRDRRVFQDGIFITSKCGEAI